MKFHHRSLVPTLVAVLCASLLALTFSSPAGAETDVDDGLVPDKELAGTELDPPSPEAAPGNDADESEDSPTGPSLPDGNETDSIEPFSGPDEAPVGQQAPVCGTHEHHQFSSGYACNSPYDPEPRVPSKCFFRVFEVLVPVLLVPASPGIWGIVGTTVVIEAGLEKVIEIYGWVKEPRSAVFGTAYKTFRSWACDNLGYSS